MRTKAPEKACEPSAPRAAIRRQSSLGDHSSRPTGFLPSLQRTHGNRLLQRLLREGFIQTALRTSVPGDESEKEAARVADQVMRMPEPGAAAHPANPGRSLPPEIHRACGCDEELNRVVTDEEEGINIDADGDCGGACAGRDALTDQPGEVSRQTEGLVANLSGRGRPLPGDVRAFFEPRFGRDFGQVRIHTGALAAESARAVDARAFTIGHNIAFGASEYAPGSREGMTLLAHELTHVVQQGAAGLRPDDSFDNSQPAHLDREPILQRDDGKEKEGKKDVKSCCCCVNSLKIDNITKIQNGHSYGHQYDLIIELENKSAGKGGPGDCSLKWEEKTNRAYTKGMTNDAWNDMFTLLPGSPTFDPWTKNRKKPCPGKETVTITDPPSADDRLPKRTLELRITLGSSADCGCASASKTVTATQVLEPDGKGGIKTQDFNTP
jgi:hypothetical protein